MPLPRLFVLLCLAACGLAGVPQLSVAGAANASQTADFDRDIRPILSENCFFCHGEDAGQRKAKLRLDRRTVALQKGAIVPGKPEESELVKRIFSTDRDEQMPPPDSHRHLSDTQRELLRAWIAQGAKYEKHWAFESPVRPPLPEVEHSNWSRNPIDNFVLARLEHEGLSPSAEAPLEKLLRRVCLDLTGLPPTPDQMQRWLSGKDSYTTAVDELLASPRFGERMASDWMDVARYADTHGFNNDSMRTMWRWRDWVIGAFNRNLPYDQFITDQLAGDLLKEATLNQRIATGFNRNHVINSEGGIIDEEYRVEYVADRVITTSLAWMGLTMGCARCHDHKFDPVTQRDYYRFFAFFNNIDETGEDGRLANAAPIMSAPTDAQQAEMAGARATMRDAEDWMQTRLREENWETVDLGQVVARSPEANPAPPTNRVVAFDLSGWQPGRTAFTNAGGGKPFSVEGHIEAISVPNDRRALVFDGKSFLQTTTLPGFDSGKGWAFRTWMRRDRVAPGPVFSTMDFSVPASSQSYGQGVEIGFTEEGRIDVKLVRRWPAYSLQAVTRERVPLGQWRHVLVTCDNSATAKGVRVFLDGRECFRNVIRDDFASIAVSGHAAIGASRAKDSPRFTGALAQLELIAGPVEPARLAEQAAHEVQRNAAELPAEARQPYQVEELRRLWLEARDAAFAAAARKARTARMELLDIERNAPTTMVMRERRERRPTFVLHRGQYDQPREEVESGVPEFLLPFPEDAPRNRLGLARWLTDPRQPLTARVVVNRFWQSFFGEGIVKSVEDLGYQADWPSHPKLLDWLAVDFIENGWDVKGLMRLIVMSATYRQNSASTPELNERDPENRLLARGPRQRLTAEMLRDQALALGGLLVDEIGGPPVFPYQPANLYKGIVVAADYPGTKWTESKGSGLYRRSLYTFWKRTVPNPTLAVFDAPDREVCVARRLRTNTPLQALALMNDPTQLEAARKLAERMLQEGGQSPEERLGWAFEMATARPLHSSEREALVSLLEQRLAHYKQDPAAAKAFLGVGASEPAARLDSAELAAYANLASLILNLDETITRN